MDIQNLVKEMKEYYNEKVKSNIEDGGIGIVRIEMGNLILGYMQPHINQIMVYHSGLGLILAANLLEKKLADSKEVPESAMKEFEVYLAQVSLSIKSGNSFSSCFFS